MATLKQIEANRRNSLKSTGPKTPEGKAAVSLNSLRHGLRARTVVLPSENRQEFDQLCDDLQAEWQPQSRTEQFYVEQMAVSQWKLNRMEVLEAGAVRQTVGAQERIPLLDRLWQAQARMERAYTRAQRELERLQKARRAESTVTVAPAIPTGLSSPSPEIGNPEPQLPPITPDLIYHAANSQPVEPRQPI